MRRRNKSKGAKYSPPVMPGGGIPARGPKFKSPRLPTPDKGYGTLPIKDDFRISSDTAFAKMMGYPMGYNLVSRANNDNNDSEIVNVASVISFEAQVSLWNMHFSVQFLSGPGVNPSDPTTWILTVKSTIGERISNEVLPIMIEILKTGVGQRANVSKAAIVWYFIYVENCLQPLIHMLAYRRLYYNADWTKIDPGTPDVPKSLITQMDLIKAFDGDFENYWMVMIRLISNKVFPPELMSIMTNFSTPFTDSDKPSCFRVFTPYAPGVDFATLNGDFYTSYQYITIYGADVEAVLSSFIPWKVGAIDLGEIKTSAIKTALWYDAGNSGPVLGITTSIPTVPNEQSIFCNLLFSPTTIYGGRAEENFISANGMATGIQSILSGALYLSGSPGNYYLQPLSIVRYTAAWIWYDNSTANRVRVGDTLSMSDNRILLNQVRTRWVSFIQSGGTDVYAQKGVVDYELEPTMVSRGQVTEINSSLAQFVLGADKLRDVSTVVGGSANREARAFISSMFGINT